MLMLLLLLSSFQVWAQNTLDDVDFSVLEPIRPVPRRNPHREEKLQYLRQLKNEAMIKSIQDSGEFLAVIQSGSILEDVNDMDKTFLVNKDINVYAYRQADNESFKYIVGKDKKIKFKIHTKYLNDITQVTDLKPKPENWTEVENVQELTAQDKLTHLRLQFNLHNEAINSRYLQEVAEARYDQVNRSLRFETQAYLRWDYPVELGASLNYQAASFETVTTAGGNYRAFHLGPIIRTHLGTWEEGEILLHLSYQRSVNANYSYRINDASYVALLTANTMELGIERLSETAWGHLSLGLIYRRQWVSMKENLDSSVRVSSASRTADSIGFSIGHDFDWKL